MTVLVTGATGNVGSAVLALLLEANILAPGAVRPGYQQIRSVSRTPMPQQSVRVSRPIDLGRGIRGRGIDVSRTPGGVVERAARYSSSPGSGHAGEGEAQCVSVAAVRRVKQGRPHAKIEKWLRSSGLLWTIFRPSISMQNFPQHRVRLNADRPDRQHLLRDRRGPQQGTRQNNSIHTTGGRSLRSACAARSCDAVGDGPGHRRQLHDRSAGPRIRAHG